MAMVLVETEALGMLPLLANARLAQAEWLPRDTRRIGAAREMAMLARSEAERMELDLVVERADALLATIV